MRAFVLVTAFAAGCGGAQAPLYPAGTPNDEGHGELARASSHFVTADRDEDDLFTSSNPRRRPRSSDMVYGGAAYGGAAYGGAAYGGFTVPTWQYPSTGRSVKHTQVSGLAGSIAGTITWRGAAPARPACAAASPRVASDGAIADVLVYVEHVSVGRPIPIEGRASAVGGTIMKRGCALAPAIQIATPLPAALSIHGDSKRARLRITAPGATPKPAELQEGGRVSVQLAAGITKIDAEDGSLSPAWVLAIDTPYYALTDERGRFRIDELAAGTYDVTIWSAAGGAPSAVHRTVRVEGGKPTRLDVSIGR